MTIGEVIRQYPQAASVFQAYGLQCVGCSVSYSESIEEGARGHGMNDQVIEAMLSDANALVASAYADPGKEHELDVTSAAAEKIKAVLKSEKKPDWMLRIAVTDGGCAGKSYVFSLDESEKEGDHVITKDGVSVIVNKESLTQLSGSTVDYVDSLQGSGFKIINPNAKRSCGCGSSFS